MIGLDSLGRIAVENCRCVRVAPDGTAVLTVGADGVSVRETAAGRLVWSHPLDALAELPVEALWSAGGESVLVLAGGRLRMYGGATGEELQTPRELEALRNVTAMALSADGLHLAVGTHGGLVLLLDQSTWEATPLPGGGDPVTGLAWHPAGRELCVARPRSIQFWNTAARTMIASLNVRDIHPMRLAWSPDGDLIVAAGLRDVRAFNVRSRTEAADPLDVRGRPVGLGFSLTGATLLVGRPDGSVTMVDRRLTVISAMLPAAVTEDATLHVNETGMVAVRADDTSVALFRLPDTHMPSPQEHTTQALRRWATKMARTVGLSADEEVHPARPSDLGTACGFAWTADGWLMHRPDGGIERFDQSGRRLWERAADPGRLTTGPDAVAISGDDGQVVILDGDSGAEIRRFPGSGPVAWSSSAIAVAAPLPEQQRRRKITRDVTLWPKELLVYDMTGGRPTTLPVRDGVGEPAWSPDGALLCAPSDRAVIVWSGRTLRRERRLTHGSRQPGAAAWSQDGRWLAIAYRNEPVVIWSTRTWTPDIVLGRSGARFGEQALAWSPDSRLLAVPSHETVGAVDLWDVRSATIVRTVPAGSQRRVRRIDWTADNRFAVVHEDDRVVRWELFLPPVSADSTRSLPHPPQVLSALAAGLSAQDTMVSLALLADLQSLLLGRAAGPLSDLSDHRGVVLLRGLRWPPQAVVALTVLIADGLPPDELVLVPEGTTPEMVRRALDHALNGVPVDPLPYEPPIAALIDQFEHIDDSLLRLAQLVGPDAAAAEPNLLARLRRQSFGGWNLTPRQRRLLGLRTPLRVNGTSQGRGIGDTRAGLARSGQLPALLPTQLALPRPVLLAKKARDELLYRTRQGELPVRAQPIVLILDDTPAAHGAVGVTLRLIANLLTVTTIREHRRCALVLLGSGRSRILGGFRDLVELWSAGSVERPDLAAALRAADAVAAQISDSLTGLPRLVILTHPYLRCSVRPGQHVVRVHYPGLPVEDRSPRTHVLAPDADPEQLHETISAILADNS